MVRSESSIHFQKVAQLVFLPYLLRPRKFRLNTILNAVPSVILNVHVVRRNEFAGRRSFGGQHRSDTRVERAARLVVAFEHGADPCERAAIVPQHVPANNNDKRPEIFVVRIMTQFLASRTFPARVPAASVSSEYPVHGYRAIPRRAIGAVRRQFRLKLGTSLCRCTMPYSAYLFAQVLLTRYPYRAYLSFCPSPVYPLFAARHLMVTKT